MRSHEVLQYQYTADRVMLSLGATCQVFPCFQIFFIHLFKQTSHTGDVYLNRYSFIGHVVQLQLIFRTRISASTLILVWKNFLKLT